MSENNSEDPPQVQNIFKVSQDPAALMKKNAFSNIRPSNMVNEANELID